MNDNPAQGGGGVPVTCGVDQVPTVMVNHVKLILRVLILFSHQSNDIANVHVQSLFPWRPLRILLIKRIRSQSAQVNMTIR